MHLLTLRSLLCRQFLYRHHDPQPNGPAIRIAGLHQFARSHGGMERCVLAVLLDKLVGGSVNVDVGDHGPIYGSAIATKLDELVSPARSFRPPGGRPHHLRE